MRAVKGSDTRPELKIRSMLHRRGLRFRLGGCGLPGKPDIVLPRWGTAIFVHGCFWHGHNCARGARTPKANHEYWIGKISKNMARDERVRNELTVLGWRVLVVWECEIGKVEALEAKFRDAFHKSKCPPRRFAPRAEETRA
jgi:DNA mismatch endonuclease (patch repair protein)